MCLIFGSSLAFNVQKWWDVGARLSDFSHDKFRMHFLCEFECEDLHVQKVMGGWWLGLVDLYFNEPFLLVVLQIGGKVVRRPCWHKTEFDGIPVERLTENFRTLATVAQVVYAVVSMTFG